MKWNRKTRAESSLAFWWLLSFCSTGQGRGSPGQPQTGIPDPESAAGDPWISSRLRKSLQLGAFITLPFPQKKNPEKWQQTFWNSLPSASPNTGPLWGCVVCCAVQLCPDTLGCTADLQTQLLLSPRPPAQPRAAGTARAVPNLQSCTPQDHPLQQPEQQPAQSQSCLTAEN